MRRKVKGDTFPSCPFEGEDKRGKGDNEERRDKRGEEEEVLKTKDKRG